MWIQSATDMYDYVIIYVDDLFVSMCDPQQFFDELQAPSWNYKLKGVGEPHYHLGADFLHDSDGTLCLGTQTLCLEKQTYVKCLLMNYEALFKELPSPMFSTLSENDWTELDLSPLCGPDDITHDQSLIGACQWVISLVHFDLAKPIMSLS